MTFLYKDEETGYEAGINDDGELFFGNSTSGYNLRDNPNNRRKIERDFERYTGKTVQYGSEWRRRKKST